MARPSFKLKKITLPGESGRIETDKYRAITTHRASHGKDWIVRRMLDTYGLKIPHEMVKSVVDHVLDTMMTLTLDDGYSCQWGDYFQIRLDVRGTFNDIDEKFDPASHEVRLTMRGGQRLRNAAKRHMSEPGNRPVNDKKRPWAKISMIHSEGSDTPDQLRARKNIVIEGSDLLLLSDSDYVNLSVIGKDESKPYNLTFSGGAPNVLENSPTRLVLKWPQDMTERKIGLPEPGAKFSIWSSGGKPGGNRRWANYKNKVTINFVNN